MDCFSDKKEDRVMSKMHVDPDMTQAACRSHCDGYMYYATQVGYKAVGGRGFQLFLKSVSTDFDR